MSFMLMAQSEVDSIGQVIVSDCSDRASIPPGRCSSTRSQWLATMAPPGSSRRPTRAGALGLYEKVGMQVSATWWHWAIDTVSERGDGSMRHRHRHERGRIW